VLGLCLLFSVACDDTNATSNANGQVQQQDVAVKTQANGLTTEQNNVKNRLLEDNKPGAIKHLYVISAYSGQCIMYSTVKGKVTSSGKRLRPTSVLYSDKNWQNGYVFTTPDGTKYASNELPQDDGTFGQSNEYIYWWDTQNRYHQIYISGGTFVTISDEPLPVKSITINVEEQK